MKKLVLLIFLLVVGLVSSPFLFSGVCTASPGDCPDKECSAIIPTGGSCMEDADMAVAMVFVYDANGEMVEASVVRCPYTHCM